MEEPCKSETRTETPPHTQPWEEASFSTRITAKEICEGTGRALERVRNEKRKKEIKRESQDEEDVHNPRPFSGPPSKREHEE
jgi:hypothetical protein